MYINLQLMLVLKMSNGCSARNIIGKNIQKIQKLSINKFSHRCPSFIYYLLVEPAPSTILKYTHVFAQKCGEATITSCENNEDIGIAHGMT